MKTTLRFAITAGMAVLITSLLGLILGKMDTMIGGAIMSALGVTIGAAFYRAANLHGRNRPERRAVPAFLAAVLTPLAFALVLHYGNGSQQNDGIVELVVLMYSIPLLALLGAMFGSGMGQRSSSQGGSS